MKPPRRLPFVLLALVGAAFLPVGSATAEMDASFAEPAQVQGDLTADGAHWALFLFHGAPAEFQTTLDAGFVQTNTTFLQAVQSNPYPFGHFEAPVPMAPQTESFPEETNATLRFAEAEWSSLLVEADSISVSSGRVVSVLSGSAAGEDYRYEWPPVAYPVSTLYAGPGTAPWLALREDSSAVNAQSPSGTPFGFSFEARGIHRIVWHNATVECPAAPCPDSGRPWIASQESFGQSQIKRLSYIQLDAPTGTLHGQGMALAMATGGHAMALAIEGGLRLPDASLAGACTSGPCPDPAGRTFLANGTIALEGLTWERTGRLHGRLTGDFVAAAFDESHAAEFTVGAGVAAGLALAGLAWLIKALLGLFARASRPPALQNPRRRQLFTLIQAEPGLSWRQLQRQLAWPAGNLRHHLGRLVDERLVVAHPHRNTVRYFENRGHGDTSARKLTITMRNPDNERLYEWLLQHPGLNQTRITQTADTWGWGRRKTRGHLASLEEVGLLASRAVGRRTEYTAQPRPVLTVQATAANAKTLAPAVSA